MEIHNADVVEGNKLYFSNHPQSRVPFFEAVTKASSALDASRSCVVALGSASLASQDDKVGLMCVEYNLCRTSKYGALPLPDASTSALRGVSGTHSQ